MKQNKKTNEGAAERLTVAIYYHERNAITTFGD